VGRRLILDTKVLIAYKRGTIDRAAPDDDELAVAAVSIAEYRVVIELADTRFARIRPCTRSPRSHPSWTSLTTPSRRPPTMPAYASGRLLHVTDVWYLADSWGV